MKNQQGLEIMALKKDLKECNFGCNFGVTFKKYKTLLYQCLTLSSVTLKVESYT